MIRQLTRSAGFGAIIGVLVMLIAFSVIDFSRWWTIQTLSSVIQLGSIIGLMAMGQALVIISKEIDLSVGSVYGLAGVSFITLQPDLGVGGAIAAAILVALLCGFIQALAIVKGQIPSMIVTLGGLFAFRGVIYVWTGGTVRGFPEEARYHWLTRLFGGEWLGVEASFFWMLAALGILTAMLWLTQFGNHLLAAGGDVKSAETRGVRTDTVKICTFMLCSGLAGLAGVITLADQPQSHVTLGELLELEAISAAVIGGCLLSGGRGSLVGAVLGAFIVVSFRYELIALGAPSSWFITFIGIALIVAVIFNQKLARWAGHSV